MALIRWEPARELTSLQSDVNRLFNTFFADAPAANGSAQPRWLPAMDVVEGDHHYVLRADLPGLGEDDVTLEVEDRVLTISGERKHEHEERKDGYHRLERATGRFSRALTLPEGVDADAIEATFERGVLEVRVPKPELPKPRRVTIGVGRSAPTVIEGGAQDEQAKAA